jgi:hypothetical protein
MFAPFERITQVDLIAGFGFGGYDDEGCNIKGMQKMQTER